MSLKNLLVIALDFLGDLYNWLNFDPVGLVILQMTFMLVFGLVTYFICTPFMLGMIEKRTAVRESDVLEWDD